MTQEEIIQETLEQNIQMLLQLAVMFTNRGDRELGYALRLHPEEIANLRHGGKTRPIHYSEVFVVDAIAQDIGRQPNVIETLRKTADFLEHQQEILKTQEALYRKHREELDAKK